MSQYKMFKMEEGESIKDLIQRFTTITNRLILLGRTFDNANLVHKVLRSLINEWYPKVTIIKKSLKIGMLTIQELYGTWEEHDLELKRYKKNGDDKKKRKLALKITSFFYDEDEDFDESKTKDEKDKMDLLRKKLQGILKDKRNKEKGKILF